MPFDNENYTPNDPVLERLVAGREMIKKGWTQGCLDDGKNVCARGAILQERNPRIWWNHADATARQADEWLAQFVPKKFLSDNYDAFFGTSRRAPVVTYNNDLKTKKKDILALFDRAIAARINALAMTVAE